MSAAPHVLVTEREYLTNPVYEHAEFVDGVIVERNVGKKKHAEIQGLCFAAIRAALPKGGEFYVGVELHCRLEVRGRAGYRIPNVAATQNDVLVGGPTLAVEVQSPGDSLAQAIRKAQDYFANGTRMVWIVLPDEESVMVLEPNQTPAAYTREQSIAVGVFEAALEIAVDAIFP